jgi:hypothetical protein
MTAKKLEKKRQKLNVCDKKQKHFAENMKPDKSTTVGVVKKNTVNFRKEKDGADNKSKKKKGVIKNRSDDSVNRNGTNNNNNDENNNDENNNNTRVLHVHAPLLLVAMNLKVQKLHWREDILPQIQDRRHLQF